MRTEFPTRQIMARLHDPAPGRSSDRQADPNILSAEEDANVSPSNLFRLVVGIDQVRVPMGRAEASEHGDRFSRDILLQGLNPLTLRALDEAIAGL
ncbi:MAG TPA: hypothetical protein VHG52_07575 [Thermomicrobiales bacterium]|nr:hypothetical protein [Thermomicrobiales bacterium]